MRGGETAVTFDGSGQQPFERQVVEVLLERLLLPAARFNA